MRALVQQHGHGAVGGFGRRLLSRSTPYRFDHTSNPLPPAAASAAPPASSSDPLHGVARVPEDSLERVPYEEEHDTAPFHTLTDAQSSVVVCLYPTTVSVYAPSEGLATPFHFDHVWLRDVCRDESSVDPASQQKLFHTTDIPIPHKDTHYSLLSQ